jgi:predicted RNA-binding protein with RPS1 domain
LIQIKKNFKINFFKAVSQTVDKEQIVICDLSPHLGHKLAASIFSNNVYVGYIEDPQKSFVGIAELILQHFEKQRIIDYFKFVSSVRVDVMKKGGAPKRKLSFSTTSKKPTKKQKHQSKKSSTKSQDDEPSIGY